MNLDVFSAIITASISSFSVKSSWVLSARDIDTTVVLQVKITWQSSLELTLFPFANLIDSPQALSSVIANLKVREKAT